jgi:hypothetical protein
VGIVLVVPAASQDNDVASKRNQQLQLARCLFKTDSKEQAYTSLTTDSTTTITSS